jgi:Gas vesicle synthesis protein GvpL/GvpF
MSEGLYVYGVVSKDAELRDPSPSGERTPEVELVEAEDLAAIVSPAGGEDEASVRESVMAHARVLETAIRDATVVPMRFGMVFPDEDTVVGELLEARHDELVQWLERLEGRVQMTLKVYFHEDAVLREIMEGNQEIARLHEQTRGNEATQDDRVRLGQLVFEATEQRRQRDGAQLLEAIEPLVVASQVEPPEDDFMVLNAPLLVERDRQGELEQRLEELAQERSDLMRFRLLGPMPAYHFVSWEEPAWA